MQNPENLWNNIEVQKCEFHSTVSDRGTNRHDKKKSQIDGCECKRIVIEKKREVENEWEISMRESERRIERLQQQKE